MAGKTKKGNGMEVKVARCGLFNKYTAPEGWIFKLSDSNRLATELYVKHPGDYTEKAVLVRDGDPVARKADLDGGQFPLNKAMAKEKAKAEKKADACKCKGKARLDTLEGVVKFLNGGCLPSLGICARDLNGLSDEDATSILKTLIGETQNMVTTSQNILAVKFGNMTSIFFLDEESKEDAED